MIGSDLSVLADQASQRYANVLVAFRGLFADVVNDPHPFAPSVRDNAIRQAYAVAREFLDSEDHRGQREVREIALRAVADARNHIGATDDSVELPSAISDHLGGFSEALRVELATQLERDVGALRQAIDRMIFEVTRASRAADRPREQMLTHYRATGGQMEFYFRDRAGRRLQSQRYVRGVRRHCLLTIYNEAYLSTLAEAGVGIAEVTHPDPKHKFNGLIFSIADDNGSLPGYAQIREEVFHPNSDATVRASVSDD